MKRIALTLVLTIMGSLVVCAQPDDVGWVRYSLRQRCYRHVDMWGAVTYPCYRHYARVGRYYRSSYNHRRDYDRDDDRERDRGHRDDLCWFDNIDVLSTEHQNEDNAREAARKLWMAKTQWMIGGQYMSLEEAAHIVWRCGPSNAHDTVSGSISQAAGVLTGQSGQNVRCALWARPCRVERSPGDERRRRR